MSISRSADMKRSRLIPLIIGCAAVVYGIFVLFVWNYASSKPKTATTAVIPSPFPVPATSEIVTVDAIEKKSLFTLVLTAHGTSATQKTYRFPGNQKVTMFTSLTESKEISAVDLKPGTMINIMIYEYPKKIELRGIQDPTLIEKLL